MASLRVAGTFRVLSLLVLGSFASGCAQSDAIEPPTVTSAAAGGGDDGAGSGGADPGPTTSTSTATTAVTSSVTTTTTGGGGGAGMGGGTTSSGPTCGDGAAEGAEACDGDDLGGATCVTEGFATGTLACDASCALDTTGCSAVVACANGLDDDGDGLVDAADPACTTADDDDELVFAGSCDGAGTAVIDLTTIDGASIDYVGSTSGAGIVNNFTATVSGACPSTPGPEVAFRFVVASAIGALEISLANPGTTTDWDPVLYVRAGSCTGAQIGCNDDDIGLASVVVLSNVQPGEYYVFVDGRTAGDAGDFEISLTPS